MEISVQVFYTNMSFGFRPSMQKLTFSALAAIAVAMGVAMLVSAVAVPVSAALECRTSPDGNAPPGQNDDKPLKEDCKGNKVITTQNGKPVPGQNK
jgi:hypothetical protein